MAWNEPGDQKPNKKDPWNRNKSEDSNSSFERFDLFEKLGKLFGSKKKDPFQKNKSSSLGVTLIALVVVGVFGYSGFYTSTDAERAVVLRFGKVDRTETAGLHWKIPFIEEVQKVDVNLMRQTQASGSMLTKDENVVDVEITVQYTITDPVLYLYKVANPDSSLNQAIDSALRYVIGHTTMDDVITVGINNVRGSTKELLESIIEKYNMGISIVNVAFKAKAPGAVKDAFDDAISAQEDEQRFKSEAEAYRNDKIPNAQGQAKSIIEEAEAYKLSIVNKAQVDVARFNKILPEYNLAPEITKKRIFLETMEQVYAANPNVIINVKNNNQMIYLPLDKMINDNQKAQGSSK